MTVIKETYQLAELFSSQTDSPLFITGKAGSGKTTFLRALKERAEKQVVVLAPTGVAAINAGGTTLHSFFQLPLSPFVPTPEGKRALVEKQQMRSLKRKLIQEIETIVIDEVSMVRADVMDAIDTVLRHVRYRRHEPFGGVQMIYIGDLHQLSPVCQPEEWALLSEFYPSPYFFHSKAIREQPPLFIEFDKIFRQTDSDFVQLLNEVRDSKLSSQSAAMLKSRYKPGFRPTEEEGYITLTTHNAKADRINNEELDKISSASFVYNAEIKGEFPERNSPADLNLVLKEGAKVMFINNDTESPRRYYNGKTGIVSRLEEDRLFVRTDEYPEIELKKDTWDNKSYTLNKETNQIEERELGKFTQYPLRLAWAITIHKSQGLTFDKVLIDAESSFAPGQVYVALSRCRTLEGVVLLTPLSSNALFVDQEIVAFTDRKTPVDQLNERLESERKSYDQRMLLSLFDFRMLAGESRRLQLSVKENAESYNDAAHPFVLSIEEKVVEIETVGGKFQQQLRAIFAQLPTEAERLMERIESASNYFIPRIEEIVRSTKEMPLITDSKKIAIEVNNDFKSLFVNLSLKCHLLKACGKGFSAMAYLKARKSFEAPPFNKSSYAGSREAMPMVDIPHYALYKQLTAVRNEICAEHDIPVYMVADSKTLQQMCLLLPTTTEDLVRVKGFGKIKVGRFGYLFLEPILRYRKEHNITSAMVLEVLPTKQKEIKQKEVKQREVKPKKEPTSEVTLRLYIAGKSVREIAQERGLAPSTIESHLVKSIGEGKVPVRDFVSEEEERQITKILSSGEPVSAAFSHFGGTISYTKLRIVNDLMASKSSAKPKE